MDVATTARPTPGTTDGLEPRLPTRPHPRLSPVSPAIAALGREVLANPQRSLGELGRQALPSDPSAASTQVPALRYPEHVRGVLGVAARLPIAAAQAARGELVELARHAFQARVWFLDEWQLGDDTYRSFWMGVLHEARHAAAN